MVLDTSGDSFGVPTPAGRLLPSSDRRSEIPWRATCTSMSRVKLMLTTDSPRIHSERSVAEPGGAVDCILDALGDQLLDLLRREPRGLGLDLDLGRHELGEYVEGRVQRAPRPQDQGEDRECGHGAVMSHA